MSLRPFEPLDPENVTENAVYFANPIYAVACANAWLAERNLLAHYPFDYLRRFYLSLLRIRTPSLEAFIRAIVDEADYQSIGRIDLTWKENEEIDDWVLKFWLLANQRR